LFLVRTSQPKPKTLVIEMMTLRGHRSSINHRGVTMNKLLAAIVVSTFALGSVSGFAADAAKGDELTKEQRMDMRDRADKLTAERAAPSRHVISKVKHAPKAKMHHAKKASRHNARNAQPQP
jgi:hypothetical protein